MTASIAPVFTVFYQGAVAPSASVYVYTTGTTTPLTTYSDAGLTVPNTNPIIADANGQVSFYIPTTTAIRLDLYTSGGIASGIFIKTLDPVYPAAIASGGSGGAEASIASASTTDLGSTGLYLIKVTGTTTITSFGSSATLTNPLYTVRFTGALTLTYNASSMILPGGASITTAAGSAGIFEYLGSGNWQCLLFQGATTGTAPALLITNTPSNAASTAFSSTYITSTYPTYEVRFYGVYANSGSHLYMTTSANNGGVYASSGYAWGGAYNANGTWTQASSASDTKLPIDLGVGGAGAISVAFQGKITFSNPNLASSVCQFEWEIEGGTVTDWCRRGGGNNALTTAINNIKFAADSGNITGTFELWGIP